MVEQTQYIRVSISNSFSKSMKKRINSNILHSLGNSLKDIQENMLIHNIKDIQEKHANT